MARSATDADVKGVLPVLEALGVRVRGHHFEPGDATFAATLARRAPHLSLGDRCCLAFTAATPGAHALTSDKAWSDLDLGVEIRQIR